MAMLTVTMGIVMFFGKEKHHSVLEHDALAQRLGRQLPVIGMQTNMIAETISKTVFMFFFSFRIPHSAFRTYFLIGTRMPTVRLSSVKYAFATR